MLRLKYWNDTVASVIEFSNCRRSRFRLYASDSASTGTYSLSLQFNQGSDPDMDTVNTQNRVQAALAQLPSEVQQVGVTTTKSSGDMAYIFSLNSPMVPLIVHSLKTMVQTI